MQQLKLIVLIIFSSLITTLEAQNVMTKNHQMNNTKNMTSTKQHQITLKKDQLFLVISSITKDGAQEAMNNYFQNVFPIASKNGFKPLANLPIDKAVSGSYRPNNFFGLYTWPNKQSIEAFSKELPDSKLRPMRLKIWDELKQTVVLIEEETTLTFHEEKVYEIISLWNKKEIKNRKIKKYNGDIIFEAPVNNYEDLNSGQAPHYIAIIEWNSKDEAEVYKHQAQKDLDNEEAFYTYIQIPETQK